MLLSATYTGHVLTIVKAGLRLVSSLKRFLQILQNLEFNYAKFL